LPVDDAAAATLKARTLTALYNERPTWLVNVHGDLDAAVARAYGWSVDISEADALARLLDLNQSRAAAQEQRPQRARRVGPEELRREPRLRLPITGGRPGEEPTTPPAAQPAAPRRPGRRRWGAS